MIADDLCVSFERVIRKALRDIALKMHVLEAAEREACRKQLLDPPPLVREVAQRSLALLPQRIEGAVLEHRYKFGRRIVERDQSLMIEVPAFNGKTCQPVLNARESRLTAVLVAHACRQANAGLCPIVFDDEFDHEKDPVPYEYVLGDIDVRASRPYSPLSPMSKEVRPDIRVVTLVSFAGVDVSDLLPRELSEAGSPHTA